MSSVPAEPQQPRPVLQASRDLGRRQPLLAREPEHEPRVDRPGPRRHHEALERREAHRRVDRAAAAHRRQRGAGAEVAGHDAERGRRLAPHSSRRPPRRVRVRQPVEPVAPDRPARAPRRAGSRRSTRPAGSVAWNAVSKQATAGTPGQRRATASIAGQRPRLVERGERRQRARCRRRAGVEHDRRREPRPAVDDPVADRADRAQRPIACATTARVRRPVERRQVRRLARTRVGRVEQPQLEAARTRVDDEDRRRSLGVGHAQFAISGASSPSSRGVRPRLDPLVDHQLADVARPATRGPGTRSITSITRWNRSRSLSITMSNGVVVVPSSL